MGRYYRFSKKITDAQAKELVKELKELDDIAGVQVTDDQAGLLVETEDGDYAEVMGRAINICSRVADGVELSFLRFAL